MFRRLLAYFLISATFIANSSQLFVYAGFELNQDYIVSSLCVNRDKPQLHCNGKCYLLRKLKQAEEKEKNKDRENQRVFFQQAVVVERLQLDPCAFAILSSYGSESSFHLPKHSSDIFQPPQV
jgi:hypothetical protein